MQEAFAREVAGALNAASVLNEVDRIILVAAPRIGASLRDALDAAVRRKIVGELPKDLTKTPDHALGPHLEAVEQAR
jgi:protein required for attachment to host cells